MTKGLAGVSLVRPPDNSPLSLSGKTVLTLPEEERLLEGKKKEREMGREVRGKEESNWMN